MPSEIRAAIFDGPGRPLRLETVPRPTLHDGEALVRIALCTVCGSDLHTFVGRRKEKTPCVLGHEPVGVVEEIVGELRAVDGEAVKVGDRVVWAVAVSCRECFFCLRGLPQKCESLRKYGHEVITPQCGPVGGLASHCHLLKGTAVVRVPSELPDAVAAPAGCATATVAAALRRCGTGPTTVVFGLGMLGLTACAWLDALGLTAIACDVSDERLVEAARFGARHAAKPDALAELVNALTGGRGADAALELSGAPAACAASLDVLRVGGTAVWVGAVSPTAAVPLVPQDVVRRCLTLTGVHNYAPRDLVDAVQFLATNHTRYPFADLVGRSFQLNNVNEALKFAESERPVRVAVECAAHPL